MAFSEAVKLEAKRRSAFRCCVCQHAFVEVHHIEPQTEGGSDDLENAAPLCAGCHDHYGGNPEKRRQIRQMRDFWWDQMAERARKLTTTNELGEFALVQEDPFADNKLSRRKCAIYHVVFPREKFGFTAKTISDLVIHSQKTQPGLPRHLFLDIDGHRNKEGGFDHDMWELQQHFVLGALMPFLTAAYLPLIAVTNPKAQRNDLPDEFRIFPADKRKKVSAWAKTLSYDKAYIADLGGWISREP